MRSRARPRKIRLRGGSLLLIAALLTGSGALRLGIEAGPALARSVDALPAASAQSAVGPETGPDRDGLHAMLEAFAEREARLREGERRLEEKAHAVEIADAAVSRKLDELLSAEAALRETLSLADGAVEKDIARLTTVYETMKPKEAAALFEEMAPEFAAGFLARMRPDAAAEVMTGLSPEAAYTISVIMAGRNARAPVD